MRKTLFFFSFLLGSLVAFAGNNIPVTPEDPTPHGSDPRSINCEVTASIDDQVVTVSFSELTASQIVVTDSANQAVFNQTYPASYSALADLSSLPAGNYTLHIYAYGYWWYGHLVLP